MKNPTSNPNPTAPGAQSRRLVVGLALVGAAFGGVALAAQVSAHDCHAEDPAANCGDCLVGNHRHTDNSGNVYCESNAPGPAPQEQCFIKFENPVVGRICVKEPNRVA